VVWIQFFLIHINRGGCFKANAGHAIRPALDNTGPSRSPYSDLGFRSLTSLPHPQPIAPLSLNSLSALHPPSPPLPPSLMSTPARPPFSRAHRPLPHPGAGPWRCTASAVQAGRGGRWWARRRREAGVMAASVEDACIGRRPPRRADLRRVWRPPLSSSMADPVPSPLLLLLPESDGRVEPSPRQGVGLGHVRAAAALSLPDCGAVGRRCGGEQLRFARRARDWLSGFFFFFLIFYSINRDG
jgi:hypothetical protein